MGASFAPRRWFTYIFGFVRMSQGLTSLLRFGGNQLCDQLCLHTVSLPLSDVVCPPYPCLGTALRKNHPGTLPTVLLIPTELFCGALIFLVLSG